MRRGCSFYHPVRCWIRMGSPQVSCLTSIVFTLLTFFTDAVEVIKALKGEDVDLHCPYNVTFQLAEVKWTKDGITQCFGRHNISQSNNTPSFCKHSLSYTEKGFVLQLTNLKIDDSGEYNCSVIKLIDPPTEEKSYRVDLLVEGIEIEFLNNTDSNCIQLLCKLMHNSSVNATFTWIKNRRILKIASGMRSLLLNLCSPDWNEEGNLTCNVSLSGGRTVFSMTTEVHRPKEECCMLFKVIVTTVASGILTVISVTFGIYIYRKRANATEGTIMFSNKVYENFSFSTEIPARPRSDTEKQEHCIYEN